MDMTPQPAMTQAEVLAVLRGDVERAQQARVYEPGGLPEADRCRTMADEALAAVAALYEAQAALLFERDECAAACDRETVAYNLARQEISTLHSAIETTRAMASNAAYARDEMRQRLRGVQELCDVNSGIVDAVREALGLTGKPGDVVERAAALYKERNALRALLIEARDYVANEVRAEMELNKRLRTPRTTEARFLARIDAALPPLPDAS